jgi:hypothetical protein
MEKTKTNVMLDRVHTLKRCLVGQKKRLGRQRLWKQKKEGRLLYSKPVSKIILPIFIKV